MKIRHKNSCLEASLHCSLLSNLYVLILLALFFTLTTSWCEKSRISVASSPVTCVDYSFNRNYIATTSTGSVKLFNAATKQLIKQFSISGAHCARFSRSASTNLLAVSSTNLMTLINLADFSTNTFATSHSSQTYLEFSTDDSILLTCGGGVHNGREWDLSGSPITDTATFSLSQIRNCKYNSASNKIAAVSNSKLRQISSGGNDRSHNIGSCRDVDYSPDDSRIVAACNDGVRDVGGSDADVLQSGNLRTVSYSKSTLSPFFAFGGDDKIVYIMNGTSNNETLISKLPTFDVINELDFDDTGEYLLAGDDDGYIYEYVRKCNDCDPGYYYDTGDHVCKLCYDNIQGCSICSSSTACVSCVEGFVIDPPVADGGGATATCLFCPTLIDHCLRCDNLTTCTACKQGYFWDDVNLVCKLCETVLPGCNRCNSSDFCEECSSNYYLDKTTFSTVGSQKYICSPCQDQIDNCLSCHQVVAVPAMTVTYKCVECQLGFFENSSSLCQACPDNCYACQSSSNCTACVNGYYPSSGSNLCVRCSITNCLKCDRTSSKCLSCSDQFYLNAAGTACVACSYPCITCSSTLTGRNGGNGFCLSCAVGYYFDPSDNTCYSCEDYASDTGEGCIACGLVTPTLPATPYIQCLSCSNQYYLEVSNYTCIKCSALFDNCLECSPPPTAPYNTDTLNYCTKCHSLGYFLEQTLDATNTFVVSTTCISCLEKMHACVNCRSDTNCTICAPGYYLTGYNNGNTSCEICPLGCATCYGATNQCSSCHVGYYFHSGSGQCRACNGACVSCTASGVCLQCEEGYTLSSTGAAGNCISCTNELGLAAGECLACSVNTTDDLLKCIDCSIGYYVNTGSCSACPDNCTTCSDSTVCNSCEPGMYLSKTLDGSGNVVTATCLQCHEFCLECYDSGSDKCLKCNVGYHIVQSSVAGVYETCQPCVDDLDHCMECTNLSPSQTANPTCLSCSIGYYIKNNGTTNKICQSCGEAIPGCYFCYDYDTTLAGNNVKCEQCMYGYAIASGGSSCDRCSDVLEGCKHCLNTSSCQNCEIGYYLTYDLSNNPLTCSACAVGCLSCQDDTGDCEECIPGYVLKDIDGLGTIECVYCEELIAGCKACSTSSLTLATGNTCEECFQEHYRKQSSVTGIFLCPKCSETIFSCMICQSSPVQKCKQCQDGYHVYYDPATAIISTDLATDLPTIPNTCQKCEDSIVGCQLCNYTVFEETSNSTVGVSVSCLSCEFGLFSYLTAAGTYSCKFCSEQLSKCLYCLDDNNCQQCQSGFYLSIPLTQSVLLAGETRECISCEATMPGCIQCSIATQCLQCMGGYYLDIFTVGAVTHKQCKACEQEGCEICSESSPTSCIKCNSKFYLNSTSESCIKCSTEPLLQTGCLECSSDSVCTSCEPGYYLNLLATPPNDGLCSLCADSIEACGRCVVNTAVSPNQLRCIQCKGTYYLSQSDFLCYPCRDTLPGCSYCINSSICESCYYGYYMVETSAGSGDGQCESCTNIDGCLACNNQTYCHLCAQNYYLDVTSATTAECKRCSDAIVGCYACVDDLTCSICQGGYVINEDTQLCNPVTVQAIEKVEQLKLVTRYKSSSQLEHSVLAKGYKFNKKSSKSLQDIKSSTKLVYEDKDYLQYSLTIKKVSWESRNSYTLKFITNNPIDYSSKDNGGNLPVLPRRVLIGQTNFPEIEGLKVGLDMDQETINQILPDLFINKDLVMEYEVDSSEFAMSYAKAEGDFSKYRIFSFVSITFCTLFFIQYVIKSMCTVPKSKEMGDILPHLMALKAPGLLVFPSYMEFIFYCYGYMVFEFPWLSETFGKIFADQSEELPSAYGLFYLSINIGSTYFLPLCLIFVFGIGLFIYYKNYYQPTDDRNRFPIGNVLYHTMIFGLIWASSLSIEGALLNPIQELSFNSGVYMFGIAVYCAIFSHTVYQIYSSAEENFYKMRILIKGTLLAWSNASPIYIFTLAIILDLLLMILDYKLLKREFPKLWLCKHICLNVAVFSLALVPSAFMTLIFCSSVVLFVLILDLYTHVKEFQKVRKNKTFKALDKSSMNSEINQNVWNITKQNNEKMANIVNEMKEQIEEQDIYKRRNKKHLAEQLDNTMTTFGNATTNSQIFQDYGKNAQRRKKGNNGEKKQIGILDTQEVSFQNNDPMLIFEEDEQEKANEIKKGSRNRRSPLE